MRVRRQLYRLLPNSQVDSACAPLRFKPSVLAAVATRQLAKVVRDEIFGTNGDA